jgi:hypothetical protein
MQRKDLIDIKNSEKWAWMKHHVGINNKGFKQMKWKG